MADYSRIKVSQDDTELTLEIYYREYILLAPKNYLTEEKKKWIESLPNQPFSMKTIYADLGKQPVEFDFDKIQTNIIGHFPEEEKREKEAERISYELDYNEDNPYLEQEIDEMRNHLQPFRQILNAFVYRVLFILNALDIVGIVPVRHELDWNYFVTQHESILGHIFNGNEKITTKKLTHDNLPSVEVEFLGYKKVFAIGKPKSKLAKLVAKLEETKLEETISDEKMTLIDIIKQHTSDIFHDVDNSRATRIQHIDKLDLIFGKYNVYQNTTSNGNDDNNYKSIQCAVCDGNECELLSDIINSSKVVHISVELID